MLFSTAGNVAFATWLIMQKKQLWNVNADVESNKSPEYVVARWKYQLRSLNASLSFHFFSTLKLRVGQENVVKSFSKVDENVGCAKREIR